MSEVVWLIMHRVLAVELACHVMLKSQTSSLGYWPELAINAMNSDSPTQASSPSWMFLITA